MTFEPYTTFFFSSYFPKNFCVNSVLQEFLFLVQSHKHCQVSWLSFFPFPLYLLPQTPHWCPFPPFSHLLVRDGHPQEAGPIPHAVLGLFRMVYHTITYQKRTIPSWVVRKSQFSLVEPATMADHVNLDENQAGGSNEGLADSSMNENTLDQDLEELFNTLPDELNNVSERLMDDAVFGGEQLAEAISRAPDIGLVFKGHRGPIDRGRIVKLFSLPDLNVRRFLEAIEIRRAIVAELSIKPEFNVNEVINSLKPLGPIIAAATGSQYVKIYDLTDLRYYRISIRGLISPPCKEALQRFLIVAQFPLQELAGVTFYDSDLGGNKSAVAVLRYNVAHHQLLKWLFLNNTTFITPVLRITWGPMKNPKYFRFKCIFCEKPASIAHATHLCPKVANNPLRYRVPPELAVYGAHPKTRVKTSEINWAEDGKVRSGMAPDIQIVQEFTTFDSFKATSDPSSLLKQLQATNSRPSSSTPNPSPSYAEVAQNLFPKESKKRKIASQNDKSEEK